MLPFSFQDFLNYQRQYSNGEGGQSGLQYDEQQWNALRPEQQWSAMGGDFMLGSNNPGYQNWAQQTGAQGGRDTILFQPGDPLREWYGTNNVYNNPGQVYRGDGFWGTPHSNLSDEVKGRWNGDNLLNTFLLTAAGIAGTAGLAGAFGGGTGSALGAAPGQGFGTALGASEGLLGGSGALGGLGDMGGLDPETWSLNSGTNGAWGGLSPEEGLMGGHNTGAPVTDLSTNAPGMFGDSSSMLGRAGQWALNNPIQALGAGQTIAGLIGGNRNSGSSSGSKSGGGAGMDNFNLQRPQFTPNPYLLAQIQRYGGQ